MACAAAQLAAGAQSKWQLAKAKMAKQLKLAKSEIMAYHRKRKRKWRNGIMAASGVAAKMSKSMAKKWRRRQRHQPAKWHRKRIMKTMK
jgi:uncharacterized Fe-S cluster-containing radical SAM superfamily protein